MLLFNQNKDAFYDTTFISMYYVEEYKERFGLFALMNDRVVVLGLFSRKEDAEYVLMKLGHKLTEDKCDMFYIYSEDEV